MNDSGRGWWDDSWSEGTTADAVSLRRSLDEFGFIVVRKLVGAEDVLRVRQLVARHLHHFGSYLGLGKTQPNAAVAVPDLDFMFGHPRVARLFNAILGQGNVIFTGHSDIHMNMLSGWHKDSGEAFGGYFSGDYLSAEDCRVYKIAMYLQDSDRRSSLALRPGSHRTSSPGHGREVNVTTRSGDVVVFDVRLDHAGQRPDLVENVIKVLNHCVIGRNRNKEDIRFATAAKAAYWRAIGRQDRLSVFFTFGYANQYTYDFSFRNAMRQIKQSRIYRTALPGELTKRLAALGVTTYDPTTHEAWPASELV